MVPLLARDFDHSFKCQIAFELERETGFELLGRFAPSPSAWEHSFTDHPRFA
jgi:hypothetical protein